MATTQNLGAGLHQALGHLLEPDVLADRQAEADAAEADRPRQRPDGEHPQLIEDTVVWEFHLVAQASDLATIEKRDGVVDLAAVRPWRADDDAGAAVGGIGGQRLDGATAGIRECGLEDEVLRRIAADEEFRQHQKIGAGCRGLRTGGPRARKIGLDIAHDGIELGDSEADGVGQDSGHGAGLARRHGGGNAA